MTKPLIEAIKSHHQEAQVAAKTAIKHAMEAGKLLVEAKAGAEHGEWTPFLEATGINPRTAQRYMELANNQHILKYDTMSHLTISEAIKEISIKPEIGQYLYGKDKFIEFWIWPYEGDFFHCMKVLSPEDSENEIITEYTKRPMLWRGIKWFIPQLIKPSMFNGKPDAGHYLRDYMTSLDRLDQHNDWEWAWSNEQQ